MTLPPFVAKLAAALRNMPCTCKAPDEWPIFQKADKARKCARCEALEMHDAHVAIVQEPRRQEAET